MSSLSEITKMKNDEKTFVKSHGALGTASGPAFTTSQCLPASRLAQFRQFAKRVNCVLHGGHYTTRAYEPTRIALKCVACGYTTPGWEVGGLKVRRTA